MKPPEWIDRHGVHLALGAFVLLLWSGLAFLAAPLDYPSRHDGSYYYTAALAWAQGEGLTVGYRMFHFGALADSVRTPAFDLWMPGMAGILGLPLAILGPSPQVALISIVFLAGLVPVAAWAQARLLGVSPGWAWLAALLVATQPNLMMWSLTTYAQIPFMLLCTLSLCALLAGISSGGLWLEAGVGVAALAHMVRGDGASLVLTSFAVLLLSTRCPRRMARAVILYALLMSPLWARNFTVFGSPMPPGNLVGTLLTQYNDFFSTTREISLEKCLAQGMPVLAAQRLHAYRVELGHVLSYFPLSFLLLLIPSLMDPKLRARAWPMAVLVVAAGIVHFIIPLTVVGQSGQEANPTLLVALPILAALGMGGLERISARSRPLLKRLLFLLVGSYAAISTFNGVSRCRAFEVALLDYGNHMEALGKVLEPRDQAVVMSCSPADFNAVLGLAGVGIPDEEPAEILRVARHFGCTHLVFEEDHTENFSRGVKKLLSLNTSSARSACWVCSTWGAKSAVARRAFFNSFL